MLALFTQENAMSAPSSRPILFLLKPGFDDGSGGRFFCPDCALVEGFLRYNPEIEAALDLRRIAFPRPRADVIALLGEAHQGCPTLILPEDAGHPQDTTPSSQTGRAFVADGKPICAYLAQAFGVPLPH